eukprot:TRINITY_DN75875_c0_g1_i1.p1 TRINITY_DN75875_c0_g1~~TRINITY_DN75875_c0_g1_i1.p1  ORF type:complete len:629 (-),score=121.62 TRINITY_DN75875_c0_g1_i1:105-1991(-)
MLAEEDGEADASAAQTDDAAVAEGDAADRAENGSSSEKADDAPTIEQIFTLARQQNFTLVSKLLESYALDWSSKDEDEHSFLHWAALVGSTDFVKTAVVQKGVHVDALAGNKQTPLMWAALRGHVETARALLDLNAGVAARDSLGATPLMIAIQHKQYSMVLLLVHRAKKVRIDLLGDSDKNGCTSAHWAAYKGDETSLKLLDYFGADMLALDNSKMQPLHRAVSASQACVLKLLVDKKSDLTARTKDGNTALDIAEKHDDKGMVMLLKQYMKSSENGKSNSVMDDQAIVAMEEGSKSEANEKSKKKESFMKEVTKDKVMQKAFPVFWLVCVSLAVFQYIMDLRPLGQRVAPVASLLFELGVPASLLLFLLTSKGDPGIVRPKAPGQTGVEELMKLLDGEIPVANSVFGQADAEPSISRLCTTSWVLKDMRTKYCAQTGACVRDFDHYCVWLNCAIGRGNHRQFVFLALAEFFTQVCHLYLLWNLATEVVAYQTFGSWILAVFTGYPLMAIIAIAHTITAPWVLMLTLHQGRLITQNLTTNEMMNMHRYDHFWAVKQVMPGRLQKTYHNPFHKGNAWRNCLDFWWYRNRSETMPFPDADLMPMSAVAGMQGVMTGGCQSQQCNKCPNH